MSKMRKLCRGCYILLLVGCIFLLAGCAMKSSEKIRLRDLTVSDKDGIKPNAVLYKILDVIEERKEEPFELSFKDGKNLYLVVGYGKQETGGYSIVVEDLYLTEEAIYVSTGLLGPDPGQKGTRESYPVIVIKTELLDKTILFE